MCGETGAAATLTSKETSYGTVDCSKSSNGMAHSGALGPASTCEVVATTGYSTGAIVCQPVYTLVISTNLKFVVEPSKFQLASKVKARGRDRDGDRDMVGIGLGLGVRQVTAL